MARASRVALSRRGVSFYEVIIKPGSGDPKGLAVPLANQTELLRQHVLGGELFV